MFFIRKGTGPNSISNGATPLEIASVSECFSEWVTQKFEKKQEITDFNQSGQRLVCGTREVGIKSNKHIKRYQEYQEVILVTHTSYATEAGYAKKGN